MSDNIRLLGRMLNFSTLIISNNDLSVVEAEIKAKLGNQSDAGGIPVVLDCEHEVDLVELLDICWQFGLQPIGVVEGVMSEVAKAKKIAIFPRGKALNKIETKTDQGKTIVFERMVRSGQSINNPEGDLVLLGGINDAAEAIATGSLHIYGNASGRLVAGAAGEPSAAIFCQNLSASLVSVAGVWCTRDDIPSNMLGRSVAIRYKKDEGLVFTHMNTRVQ